MIFTDKEFSEVVEQFLGRTKMGITLLGRKGNADARFVYDLRKGRCFGEKIKNRVLDFMRNYAKDKGIEWEY